MIYLFAILLIFHRGDHGIYPENTLQSFRMAAESGDGFECDIRKSVDGVLFVFHDADLRRMTGNETSVYSVPYWQLRGKLDGYIIPTLKEVLELAHETEAWVVLDIKDDIGKEVADMADYFGVKILKISRNGRAIETQRYDHKIKGKHWKIVN